MQEIIKKRKKIEILETEIQKIIRDKHSIKCRDCVDFGRLHTKKTITNRDITTIKTYETVFGECPYNKAPVYEHSTCCGKFRPINKN